MHAADIKVGCGYRALTCGRVQLVTVLRAATVPGSWRCRLSNHTEAVVATDDFIQPAEEALLCVSSAETARSALGFTAERRSPRRGFTYFVRHDGRGMKVEVLYQSLDVFGGWIVRRFADGTSFVVHERDFVCGFESEL
jgi:hypothetical protein